MTSELEALAHPKTEESWSSTVARLVRADEAIHKAETDHVERARARVQEVARWAGLSGPRLAELNEQLELASAPVREGRPAEALASIRDLLRDGLPEAVERRRTVREAAATLLQQAKEHGAPVSRLEAALDAGAEASVERWPETVPATEAAAKEAGEALRARSKQSLEGLRASVDATVDYGLDPSDARRAIEEAIARIETAPALEIHPIFLEARRVAEEPVVTVIASVLDEVRPKIAEARRLGRDPSEVFAAMNRAREALRLKIYSEAFAASQEALDRVSRLTEDVGVARDELQSLEEMTRRFQQVGFSAEAFESTLGRIRAHLDHGEVALARELLRETVVRLGREALQFFLARWTVIDRVREYAQSHGFLTPEAGRSVEEARVRLDHGELAEAAELVSRSEVELRTAAGPYVARRVEEMEKGLADIPDDALAAPVRRMLADTDVGLRVKQDLVGAIESLRRAERDFAAVFAAHASALVEMLEAESRVLEQMGGTSDEIQRQIDEVQQIFNMGDFVKASRASQEIRTRAHQQQLLRSEEAVSHAKLSLVELETMGLDLAKLRTQLEAAQEAARGGRFLEAYTAASRLEEAAGRARSAAQSVLEAISRTSDELNRLREAGADPAPFYEPLRNARVQLQALEFDAARATVEGVQQSLGHEEARLESGRLLQEAAVLIEDSRRLSLPMDPFQARLEQLKTERATAAVEATRTGARLLHDELVTVLRPVLEENLRALETDLDIARGAGVDLEPIMATLAEARRRVALEVPVGAASLIDAARGEFVSTRGLIEHAERVANRAREALAQADLLHAETVSLRGRMDRAEQLLTQKQYARVIELCGPLERELIQATYQHVSKTLAGFQAMVTRIRATGIDTSLAENLLHRARMALDEGKSVEALQLAARSEGELERGELQRQVAEGSLQAAGAALAKATGEGIRSVAANDEFEAAKVAFSQHAYPDVLEMAMEALDALAVARDGHRRAQEALAGADRQLAEATGHGADTTDASRRLEEARRLFGVGQYAETIRAAREATEGGRWAIERMLAIPVGDLRRQVETGQRFGLTNEIDPLVAVLNDAETSLRNREWTRVRDLLGRADQLGRRIFESAVDGRRRELESEYGRLVRVAPAEVARRAEVLEKLGALRERHEYGAAFELIRGERELAARRRKEEAEARAAEFKNGLWVGERLGVDTTPVMQTFSEAHVAIEAGRIEDADAMLARAATALGHVIREPFVRKLKENETEVNFAEEGLRVAVGSIRAHLTEVEGLDRAGRILEAARLLLKTEEELNLRKSLHRELMNLHYLVDAALARAHDRHLDTTAARALLSESIRLRESDYAAALEKAREALRKLQEEGAGAPETPPATPTSTPLWPFRRSP